jgi:hypothetical protein
LVLFIVRRAPLTPRGVPLILLLLLLHVLLLLLLLPALRTEDSLVDFALVAPVFCCLRLLVTLGLVRSMTELGFTLG